MLKRIAIDLDNTVFDIAATYRAIIESLWGKYIPPVSYDVYKNGYPVAVADALRAMLESDEVYKTNVFDKRVPAALNDIYQNPGYELFYITERLPKDHFPTHQQLQRANIICADNHLVHSKPKIEALKKHQINLCFDDAPHVVADCLANNIDVVMISNEDTAYNHHLRKDVEYYPDLMTALKKRGFVK